MKHYEMLFPELQHFLVTVILNLKLGASQEELFHLELGRNISNSVIPL